MKQIQVPNEVFIKTLGYQKPTNDAQLRLLAYCLVHSFEDGVLLYNSLSCEMLYLDKDESEHIYENDYLRKHWFLVPECFDDMKFAKQFRSLYYLLVNKPDSIKNYTIFTTTDCNAQCFYCYEKGIVRTPMSLDTAEKVSNYIIHNTEKYKLSDSNECVHLHWFGGEPLYNSKVIYAICNNLAEAGIKFKSHMISNGYLFDESLVKDAKQLWKLKDVQITLDGTEKVYNRTKAYIYKGVNAYERVLNNIDLLLENRIQVMVRMNIDMHNADDLKELALLLADRFGHSEGFSCYSSPLFEVDGESAHLRSDERREMVYVKQQELIDLLAQKRLFKPLPAPKSIPLSFCMADNGRFVVVVPSGHVGLCEHYSESDFISHVDNPDVINKDVKKSFCQRCEDLEICSDCAYYPQCIRLKKCVERTLCFPQIKRQNIDKLKRQMTVTYERWLKKTAEVEDNTVDDEDGININC